MSPHPGVDQVKMKKKNIKKPERLHKKKRLYGLVFDLLPIYKFKYEYQNYKDCYLFLSSYYN